MKKALLVAFVLSCAFAVHAQTTQIIANNISYFGDGSAHVTGRFCVTPTDQVGTQINLETSAGQQFAQTSCFAITNGVLASNAIVPDTALSQPVNACLKLRAYDASNTLVASYACLQPTGATWSFDSYVPTTLPNIAALTAPQFQLNGSTLANQRLLNFICPGCTYTNGSLTLPVGGSGGSTSIAANTILGNNTGSTANAFALTPTQLAAMLNTFFDAPGAATAAQAASLQKSSNLSDLANAGTARGNLGLGNIATHATSEFDSAGAASTAQTAAQAASLPRTTFTVGSGGVTAGRIVSFDASGNAIAATGTGFGGLAAATVAASGTVEVVRSGLGTCTFDGAAVINDIAIPSTTTIGECHDSGATSSQTIPSTTSVVGVVESTVSGAGVNGTVRLHGPGSFGVQSTATGALLASNNLSDLGNAGTARTNLGLGSAATTASTAYDASGAAVAAVNGAINPTSVGATTPGTGAFTVETSKVINGISYSNLYSGSTVDVRVKACLADAIAKTNGNTTTVCDASGETGTQTVASEIDVGDSAGDAVALILPCNGVWITSITDGVSSVVNQYGGTSVYSECPSSGPAGKMVFTQTGSTSVAYIYRTTTSAFPYLYARGFNVKNSTGSHATTSNVGFLLQGPLNDGTTLDEVNVFDQWDTYTAEAYNVSSGITWQNSSFSAGNFGTAFFAKTDGSGNTQSLSLQNDTLVHPGPGGYAFLCQDTRTQSYPAISSAVLDKIYTETGTDGVTPVYKVDGCGKISMSHFTVKSYSTATNNTTTGVQITSAYNSNVIVEDMRFQAGSQFWTYPVTAVANANDSTSSFSDSLGNVGWYSPLSVPLQVGFVSTGVNPAQTGALRLSNSALVVARNAANSADVNMFRVNGGNQLQWLTALFSQVAGAASAPGFYSTGGWYSGGTSTTTFPYIYLNPGATAPATFSTAGTAFGGNAPSGFTGNFLDFHLNGGNSLFSVNYQGAAAGAYFVGGTETVAFSATPTFSTAFAWSRIVLSANITGFTLAAGTDGQRKCLDFAQNGTGGFTVAGAPASLHGFFSPGTTASKDNVQCFDYNSAASAWLSESAGVINQ